MDAFIGSLLERLLATSLQTAALATAVWMLCRYAPRLSPASQCWLWWLVALQGLLGLVANPVELAWLPQTAAAAPDLLAATQLTASNPGNAAVPHQAEREWISWQSTVLLLWSAGMLIISGFTLRNWRGSNTLLRGSSPCNDERLSRALTQAAASCGLRTVPYLRLSDRIYSPVLIGHIRPTLLLPAAVSLNDDELEMALTHELTHLRRGDLWWGLVPALARHLFFFHPFAHLAEREYGVAREAACDAAAVTSRRRCRQVYGRLLVRLGASPESHTGLAVGSPTFNSLKRRLAMLQNTTFLSRAASIFVVAIVAAGIMPLRLVVAADAPDTLDAAATPTPNAPPGPTSLALSFLDTQIAEFGKRLQEAEARVAEFKRTIAMPDKAPYQDAAKQELKRLSRDYEVSLRIYEELVARRQRALSATPDAVNLQRVSQLPPLVDDQQKQSATNRNVQEPAVLPMNEQTRIRQAFAMDAVVDDRVNPDGTPLDLSTYGRPICRVTRDGVPGLEAAGRESNVLEALRQLAKGCRPLNIFGASSQPAVAPPAVQMTADEYRITPGTVLQILVLRNPELSVTAPVRPDGRISTPLVKDLVAVGKTPSQLASDIESALKEFIMAPKVTVIVQSATVSGPQGAFSFSIGQRF